MKALSVACLVVIGSVAGALFAHPLLVVAWQTLYVGAAWPAQATVSVYETMQHAHWLTTTQHKGWRIIGWTRWMLPAYRERNYRALHAATPHALLVRWGLRAEVAAVLLVVVVPLARALWAPVWFILGRAGRLTPGTAHGAAR